MVFSSITFLWFFLPICLIGYYLIRARWRNLFLLIASLIFYAWGEPIYVLLMLASITINYFDGLWISGSLEQPKRKKAFLVLGVSANLAMLGFFKYFSFFTSNVNALFGTNLGAGINIILPIGISFYTFQAMSYIIDLYREKSKVQHNFLDHTLYITFFPQLIAGPIVKYHDIEYQLKNRTTDMELIFSGFRRFAFGLAKKVLIANVLAATADKVFAVPEVHLSTSTVWLGIICYTLQIYFDFSGYSDMAVGLGRMFGFKFMENFNYPYISLSIKEFWRRWHISLSTWFKEYVYIPLGGSRKGAARTYMNLLIVFFFTGLWHGASWTFVIWGLYNGFYLIIERLFLSRFLAWNKVKIINVCYTIFAFTTGWVFFRSESIGYAIGYLKKMFFLYEANPRFSAQIFLDPYVIFIIVLGIILCGPLQKIKPFKNWLFDCGKKRTLATICVFVLISLSVVSLATGTYNPFIYFRF